MVMKLLKNKPKTPSVTTSLGNENFRQFVSMAGCKRYAKIKAIKNGASVFDTR